MRPVYLASVGLAAPGLPNWNEGRHCLAGAVNYESAKLGRYSPRLLPANERRRATNLIRLAFQAAEDAILEHDIAPGTLATVFASSGGDYDIIDSICRALMLPDKAVSPTQFHNSVHNAAAGYFSIGTGSQEPSVSLSAYQHTFAAGLLEAVVLATVEAVPVLLVVYDTQPPFPLAETSIITVPFASAFLLTPGPSGDALASLHLSVTGCDLPLSVLSMPDLESLRLSNPAARSLPLLVTIASESDAVLGFSLPGAQRLKVEVKHA